jgi:hypothetical protein
MIFFSSPIAGTLMVIAIIVILAPFVAMLRKRWMAAAPSQTVPPVNQDA